MIITIILLLWAVACLLVVLFMIAARHHIHAPKPEPRPTLEQVNGVVDVYEILGMYDGRIQ